jgi:hypothetical protein
MGEVTNRNKILQDKLKGTDHLGDVGKYGRTVLN